MRRRGALSLALALVMSAVFPLPGAKAATGIAGPTDDSTASLKVVFSALYRDPQGRTPGRQQIYTATGAAIHTLTDGTDAVDHNWVSWALNGTKIVYTAKSGAGDEEAVYMMDADGSNRRKLTDNHWRNGQPKVSPDGRSLIFSSFNPEYVRVGIFRLDLATLLVENLTGRTLGAGALDGDPRWSEDGREIVFASSYSPNGSKATQIFIMNADGTNRRQLTDDSYFNTDPSLSPDGRFVAYSSYRGSHTPKAGDENVGFFFPLNDWHLVVLDRVTDELRVLTSGKDCAHRITPCGPRDGSAWVPHWSPDGKQIGFQSIMSGIQAGLYVMDPDGSHARALLERSDIAISYWDWTPSGHTAPASTPEIGAAAPKSRLLYGGSVFEKGDAPPPGLFAAGADRWVSNEITPDGYTPRFARWSPDRSRVVFTAKTVFDPDDPQPGPPPPEGSTRRTHLTVDTLDPGFEPPVRRRSIADEQIFMMETDGNYVLQLTTPWTEDYLDALPDGDRRGNMDPDFSPDGRYVVFSSVSTLTFESFILRIDLTSGAVVSLTNVTSGATPIADAQPRYSPDGESIAFVSAVGKSLQVFVMDADGSNVHQITDDDYYNAFPTWAPDGSAIAYASYRGEQFPVIDESTGEVVGGRVVLQDWFLVKVDVATRAAQVLTTPEDSPVFRPVWSPEGDRIAYISAGMSGQPDIYVIHANGGRPQPLAVTLLTKEEYVDWR